MGYSKVNITWQPPENPNGFIAEYQIEVVHHEANIKRLIDIRSYCDADYKPPSEAIDDKKETPKDKKPKIDPQTGTCDCSQCGKNGDLNKGRKEKEADKVEEEIFLDTLLNLIYFY